MVIKKFEEFVNELWSKGVERNLRGEKRLGDETDFEKYIKNIEWVDMGHPDVLFAKYDFPKSYEDMDKDECMFSLNEVEQIAKSLPNGVKILSGKQIDWLKRNCHIVCVGDKSKKSHMGIECISRANAEKIFFKIVRRYLYNSTPHKYYHKTKKVEFESLVGFKVAVSSEVGYGEKPTPLGRKGGHMTNEHDKKEYSIKLVKEK